MPAASSDRRRYVRVPLAMSVKFDHEPTGRQFPARCVDISQGGLMMYVSATAPVKVGQRVCLDLAAMKKPELSPLAAKPLAGEIVHVNRHELVTMGRVAVGVRFESESARGRSPAEQD